MLMRVIHIVGVNYGILPQISTNHPHTWHWMECFPISDSKNFLRWASAARNRTPRRQLLNFTSFNFIFPPFLFRTSIRLRSKINVGLLCWNAQRNGFSFGSLFVHAAGKMIECNRYCERSRFSKIEIINQIKSKSRSHLARSLQGRFDIFNRWS